MFPIVVGNVLYSNQSIKFSPVSARPGSCPAATTTYKNDEGRPRDRVNQSIKFSPVASFYEKGIKNHKWLVHVNDVLQQFLSRGLSISFFQCERSSGQEPGRTSKMRIVRY